PNWGTLSGIHATIGGGLSQNSIFWGSGRYGSAADSVIGLAVVLADGSVVSTGAGSQVNGTPFFRHFGPDLTGLFCCDTGALGFKATATLKLIPELSTQRYYSCEFDNAGAMMRAMSEISRRGLAMECFGFDPFLTAQRLQRESLMNDVKALAGVMKASGSVLGALKDGAKIALAGRGFLDKASFSLHLMFEEDGEQLAEARLAAAREIVIAAGGEEIENSIPKILRANPFTPLNNVVGPRGERWGPIHVLVPHSKAAAMHDAINAVLEQHQAMIAQHDVGVGFLYATVGHSTFVLEPVFYWPDAMTEIHRRTVEPAVLEKLPGFEADPEARAAVELLRREFLAAFRQHGGVHMQIGRTYPYIDAIQPGARALIEALKAAVDPDGRVNPGSLGLG
ncbi:MAG: FAD-binding oxidoreductase, partial [Gammaproteobacteria bacterium]|nr:FAD-binding oxidoreductase [Gammaproteobacteria bacterium]